MTPTELKAADAVKTRIQHHQLLLGRQLAVVPQSCCLVVVHKITVEHQRAATRAQQVDAAAEKALAVQIHTILFVPKAHRIGAIAGKLALVGDDAAGFGKTTHGELVFKPGRVLRVFQCVAVVHS